MQPVAVRILHPLGAGVGELERALLDAREQNGRRLAEAFLEAGADDVTVVSEPSGRGMLDADTSFGARLRRIAAELHDAGLVVAGSGAVPLATVADLRRFVEVAASGGRRALANNRYSADILAVGDASALVDLPDLPGDNALPRWLAERAGFEVGDLRDRSHLAMDLDSPLDVLLTTDELPAAIDAGPVTRALDAIRGVARDPRAELLVAGRTSAATLAWLESATAGRVRALVEERGLRASTRLALADSTSGDARRRSGRPATAGRPPAAARPARSILGLVLDDRGPAALGRVLAELGDAAIVDSRVLLAHRLRADERAWPVAEDRFASDLLLESRIADPWLRDLTAAALDAAIPILLGGHSLVGPGIRLVLGGVA